MAKKDNVKNIESARRTRTLTNGEIHLFQMHPSIKKLIDSKELSGKFKLRLYKFIISIVDSDEAKALQKLVSEMIEDHQKADPENPLQFNDPIFAELFEQDSTLEINLFKMDEKDIPSDFTTQDMLMLNTFFSF